MDVQNHLAECWPQLLYFLLVEGTEPIGIL